MLIVQTPEAVTRAEETFHDGLEIFINGSDYCGHSRTPPSFLQCQALELKDPTKHDVEMVLQQATPPGTTSHRESKSPQNFRSSSTRNINLAILPSQTGRQQPYSVTEAHKPLTGSLGSPALRENQHQATPASPLPP